SPNLCQNGGVCEETTLGPKCHCHQGWHGLYCQYDIDECQLSAPVCMTPATCINLPGTFRCICPVNSTGISCTGEGLYATNIISSQLHITLDEIIGILVVLSVLAVTGFVFAVCMKCKHKSQTHRPFNNRDQSQRLLKNEINVQLKRHSKMSNFEMSHTSRPLLGQRPTSCADPLQTLNNFNVEDRSGDELETNICAENMRQNFQKKSAPIASVSPQMIDSNAKSASKKDSKKQIKILNDAKPSACKASTPLTRVSFGDSDSNVFTEEQTSLTNSQIADGYHWDSYDLAQSDNKPICSSNLFEVSVNEIHDLESNSDNSQIELSCNGSQERAFIERAVSHESSPLLSRNDRPNEDIPFADTSEPSSPQKYLDLYLPNLSDNEWSNNKRKNILTYSSTTTTTDSMADNINGVEECEKAAKDCNNGCDLDVESECEEFDEESNQQSTYV
ncbi:unnamed protein product, partial [Oppiella nova]